MLINEYTYTPRAKYTNRLIDVLVWGASIQTKTPRETVQSWSVHDVCVHGCKYVFDFPYTFYKEEEKTSFEVRFCEYYAFYEIGCDTLAEWKSHLRSWLTSNIYRYNKLYESTLLEFEILENTSVIEEYHRANTNSLQTTKVGGTESTSGTVNRQVFSDTPQTVLSPDKDYATTLNDSTNTINNNTTADEQENANNTSDETYTYSKRGNIGVMTYDQLLTGYRNSLLSVDMVVYDEMRDLFMLVY